MPCAERFGEPVNLFDTHKFGHVIACGARAAEEQLPYLRQLLAIVLVGMGLYSIRGFVTTPVDQVPIIEHD